MALVESLKILLMKAGRNDNSGAHQEQSLICGELVSEVPVGPGHSGSMPPLIAEGNVVDSHIQFDFPRSS